ncbi:MAG: acyltransferase [Opitutaceae bacterium]
MGDEVHFYGNTMLQTGSSGRIRIGAGTHVQPGCTFSAHVGEIVVGARCEIASACSFYSYNHGIAAGREIMEQPLVSHGGIRIGDSVWLGHGVSVLDNVEIGNGAVIGAGSVVVKSIPENAIAAGVPARVIRMRS